MVAALDGVLGRRVHPSRVDEVDADAVAQQGEGGVAGERVQRALRRGVGEQEHLAAVAGDAADVDDRAGDALALHDPCRRLGEQQRRPHVDRHQAVDELGGGVPDAAPIGLGGGVDEPVDDAEALVDGGHHRRRGVGVAEVDGDEDGVGARPFEASDALATVGGRARRRRPDGPAFGGESSRRLAETLGRRR